MSKLEIGKEADCILLDKPNGKRTGETARVKVINILYHLQPKGAVRSVRVRGLVNGKDRDEWVDPRYLLSITVAAEGAAA